MLYHTTDAHGITRLKPSPVEMRRLLNEAAKGEDTRCEDITLVNDENGWSLGWTPQGGLAVWENLDDADERARFQKGLGLEQVWKLWQELAAGRIDRIEAEPWQDGAMG